MTPAAQRGYAGTIRTLTVNSKVRIVANDRKETEGAPDFRIMAGSVEVGAAWRRTKQGTEESYLRVRLDDPAWPHPVWGALIEATEDEVVRLVCAARTRTSPRPRPLGERPMLP